MARSDRLRWFRPRPSPTSRQAPWTHGVLRARPVPGPHFHPEITKIAQFLGQGRRLFEGAVPIVVRPALTHVL